MLGLPKKTEMKKQLPKNAIYSKFNMNATYKDRFDADIKRITIVNEISEATVAIEKGEKINMFFVLLISLKHEEFDEKNIVLISKQISQKMLFILRYEDKVKLAIFHTKLMQTEWQRIGDVSILLKGLNLDRVWENIVVQVSGVQIEEGNSLEEQIEIDEQRDKTNKFIEKLEKQARAEKQPNKKYDLVQEIRQLREGQL